MPETPPTADADAWAVRLVEEQERLASETPLRRPTATYRVQVHKDFRFPDVTRIVDYLHELGVTDAYLSPHFAARPGSTHGYDVFDHDRLNPELGDESDYRKLAARLAEFGMGRVIDIVPNHMGIAGGNRAWLDVLEVGPQSRSARFFDIDWDPVNEALENRVLLPILEAQYGEALERGLFRLERDGGRFHIRYHDTRLPLAPLSYAFVLERRGDVLDREFDSNNEHVMEYRSILDAARNLPPRTALDSEPVQAKLREKEVIKRRLDRLCRESPPLRSFLDANVALFNGTPDDPRSFDLMHELLERQVYRLAYWRVASEEINYRRFFDVNDLAGLRTEDPEVFEAIHALVFRWVEGGGVTALRIDHPDGLADPPGYFRRLQESLLLLPCRRRFDEQGGDAALWPAVAEAIRRRYRAVAEADATAPLARRFPIVAEKILSRGEDLPTDWPIDGTVGYEYLNMINGLFVDPDAGVAVEATYAEFSGDRTPFAEVLYQAKDHILRVALASEVNMLARRLNRISERDRHSRDFTLNELRGALRQVMAYFPVYRTYIRPGEEVAARDRAYVEQAVARARRRSSALDPSLFAFLQGTLLLEHPAVLPPEAIADRETFVMRVQQMTGPAQAKGLEDTAFYRQAKLASLNEVGGDPSRFGVSPSAFHALNAHRLNRWPGSFGPTATHDTKRGEDTRVRIDAISELADEFRTRLARWSRWNARKKTEWNETQAPDPRDEYLLYQTLIGTWPFDAPDGPPPAGYVERIQQYMLKAAREAKLNTSWTDPDPSYGEILTRFVAEILESADAGPFLNDFLPFQRRVARIGVVHSLAQVLLKIASPGVPDTYQGCELWDFSLVDPDNRRPVDYDLRRRLLGEIRGRLDAGEPRRNVATSLLAAPEDGAIKLYATWTLLNHRRANNLLYSSGTYRPIEVEGERRGHVVAFGRYREGRTVIAVAPRLAGRLMGDEALQSPVGRVVWTDARLILPEAPNLPRRWRDILTDTVHEIEDHGNRPTLPVAVVLGAWPMALLADESS
jgi:(1->4)-alpha-D-glucan 1-alpha-D-glucosylmutase